MDSDDATLVLLEVELWRKADAIPPNHTAANHTHWFAGTEPSPDEPIRAWAPCPRCPATTITVTVTARTATQCWIQRPFGHVTALDAVPRDLQIKGLPTGVTQGWRAFVPARCTACARPIAVDVRWTSKVPRSPIPTVDVARLKYGTRIWTTAWAKSLD